MSVGRNDPCPCGSGRKYKHCCARPEAVPVGSVPASPRALAAAQFNEGVALHGRGRLGEASERYRRALAFDPSLAVAHVNLGNAQSALGHFADAARSYRDALALRPDDVDARYNLGVSLHSQRALDDAVAQYRDVVARRPTHAQAHYNLGGALRDLGRLDEALASYRRAVALRPDVAEAHASLGQLLASMGDLAGAVASYRAALARTPADAAILNNLGNAQSELGDMAAATSSYARALARSDTPELRANFARCLRHVESIAFDPALRALLVRALDETWTRPADLAGVAARAIDANATIDDFARDPLLRALLVSAPVCVRALEEALTRARRALLDDLSSSETPFDDDRLAFACALAQQAAIDEYVWSTTPSEQATLDRLRGRVVAEVREDRAPTASVLAVLAAYETLAHLPARPRLDDDAPAALRALVAQQIDEPAAEREDAARVPQLTPVDDAVSRAVRQQYEENPYPRWTRAPWVAPTPSLNGFLRQQFPFAPFEPLANDRAFDMLVAGCGTGQEAIDAARQFPDARLIAVDLSRASLGYAQRKARELGVINLAFGQADLLHLASLAQSFDVISSMGVLHHLRSPQAGLDALVTRLRPGGFLRIGLYSERARRDIVAARAFLADRYAGATLDDIRRCREDLLAQGPPLSRLAERRDFYSTSECRDLLLHVQEHRFTIPMIAKMIAGAGLQFVGFLLEPNVHRQYAQRYRDDRAANDLAQWDAFEADHPDTFRGMYRFWLQKPRT